MAGPRLSAWQRCTSAATSTRLIRSPRPRPATRPCRSSSSATRRAGRARRSRTPAAPRRCKAAAEAAGIDLYVHAPYVLNVATTNNRIRIPGRKLLQQTVDAAAEIGAKGVIVHGGHLLKNDDPAIGFDNWRKCVDGARAAGAAAHREHRGRRQRHGPPAGARSPGSGTRSAPPRAATPVGFCLDTCHAHAGGEELADVVDRVRAITGRIDLVHANDSPRRVRLRRRPARQLRRRHIDAGRPRRRRPAAGAPVVVETPGGARVRAPTSPGCATGCRTTARSRRQIRKPRLARDHPRLR